MDEFSKRTLTVECLQKVSQEVKLYGWIQTVRSHGKIAFFDLRDRLEFIQVVGTTEALASTIAALGQQDVVEVSGKVKKREERYINPSNVTGTIEIEATSVNVLSKAEALPFDMGGKDLELQLPTLLDYRSLTLRHPKIKAIFKVQAEVLEGFRKAAKSLDCTEIFVPTIAASSTEGGSEVFRVDYYDYKAFLTQSPQLYKQIRDNATGL
ncbi:MAG: hypothetical protein HYT83_00580 [Candidatus Levybacteria bacterium]|nr:hypothetical protein [Candidatus Levybacteria bacterium]